MHKSNVDSHSPLSNSTPTNTDSTSNFSCVAAWVSAKSVLSSGSGMFELTISDYIDPEKLTAIINESEARMGQPLSTWDGVKFQETPSQWDLMDQE